MYVDVSTISKYENAKAEKKINIEYLISVIFPAIGKSIDDLDEFLVKEEYKELFSAIREEGKTITNYIRLSLKKIKKNTQKEFLMENVKSVQKAQSFNNNIMVLLVQQAK